MTCIFIVIDHMTADIPTAPDFFALKADPIFFGVLTFKARLVYLYVLKLFNIGDVLVCAMRAIFDRLDCKESHQRPLFIWIVNLLLFLLLLLFFESKSLHLVG